MEQSLFFRDRLGHRTSAILAGPERPTSRLAVLCHGFLSHKNSTTNKTLARQLHDRDIATLRFDFFGHGDSDGPFERITTEFGIAQATAAIEEAVNRGYRHIGLVGSSFGGLVSILTASRWTKHRASRNNSGKEPPPLACLALKCPVVDFAEELRLEFGESGMSRWKATGHIPNILGGTEPIALHYGFYEECLGLAAYEPARTITAPTLIVQGGCDELVPPHQSRRLAEALAGVTRLEILPDADHQFSRAEDFHKMIELIIDWLAHYLPHPESPLR